MFSEAIRKEVGDVAEIEVILLYHSYFIFYT